MKQLLWAIIVTYATYKNATYNYDLQWCCQGNGLYICPWGVVLHIGVKGPPQQGTDSTINSMAVDTDGQQETNYVCNILAAEWAIYQ